MEIDSANNLSREYGNSILAPTAQSKLTDISSGYLTMSSGRHLEAVAHAGSACLSYPGTA